MAQALPKFLTEGTPPDSEELVGRLYRSPPRDAVEIAKSIALPQRSRLAVFCYGRRHLHELGLMIASTCDRTSLVQAAGNAGGVIFDQSRDPEKTLSKERFSHDSSRARPISLVKV